MIIAVLNVRNRAVGESWVGQAIQTTQDNEKLNPWQPEHTHTLLKSKAATVNVRRSRRENSRHTEQQPGAEHPESRLEEDWATESAEGQGKPFLGRQPEQGL